MVDREQSPEDSIEVLLSKARKGATAEGIRGEFGDYLWARLWKAVTQIANAPPQLDTLLMLRSEVSVCMKIAQDLQFDIANATVATVRVKKMFTAQVPLTE